TRTDPLTRAAPRWSRTPAPPGRGRRGARAAGRRARRPAPAGPPVRPPAGRSPRARACRRRRRGVAVLRTQGRDGVAHVLEAAARRTLVLGERGTDGGRVVLEGEPCTAQVQQRAGQAVADEVVHLAGDPVPLVGARPLGELGLGRAELVDELPLAAREGARPGRERRADGPGDPPRRR